MYTSPLLFAPVLPTFVQGIFKDALQAYAHLVFEMPRCTVQQTELPAAHMSSASSAASGPSAAPDRRRPLREMNGVNLLVQLFSAMLASVKRRAGRAAQPNPQPPMNAPREAAIKQPHTTDFFAWLRSQHNGAKPGEAPPEA